jgi:hypothetical protein
MGYVVGLVVLVVLIFEAVSHLIEDTYTRRHHR